MLKTVAVAALAMSVMGSAARAADASSGPSPELIAKAHAFAASRIKFAAAEDLFEVVDYKGIPTARHIRSGMRCHFLGESDNIEVILSGAPRGDDVGCSMHVNGFTLSFYATRFPQPKTVDEAMAMYVNSVFKQHPDTKPLSSPDHDIPFTPDPRRPAFPTVKTARYVIAFQGVPSYSRLSVAVVNGWVLEERLTGPLDKAEEGDRLGSTEMYRNVNWMHGADLLPPQ